MCQKWANSVDFKGVVFGLIKNTVFLRYFYSIHTHPRILHSINVKYDIVFTPRAHAQQGVKQSR